MVEHIMSNQMTLDMGKGTLTEKQVYELLLDDLWRTLDDCAIPRERLSSKRGKSFSSLYLNSSVMCHLCYRKNFSYIEIPTTLLAQLPAELRPNQPADARSFVKLDADTEPAVLALSPLLCAVLNVMIDRLPKEWDCCSRYLACSDAKKCVHPDQSMAVKCGYRRILNSGRIFYGKNQNV